MSFISFSSVNKSIVQNVIGTFVFKGLTVLINMLCIPLYLKYFNNDEVLGIWFTIINVLNWILTFDLGIGNGLRNHLTIVISKKDKNKIKRLISSSYIMLGGIILIISSIFFCVSGFVNWNLFFNVNSNLLNGDALLVCINITMIGILSSFFFRLVIAINYALQKSVLNNLLGLLTALFTYLYLLIASPSYSIDIDFFKLSVFHAIVANIPLILITFYSFSNKELRGCLPSWNYYDNKTAKSVFSLGIIFLSLQILYMIITVTNEWFISKFYNPVYCVQYQIYFKLFSMVSMIYMLALTPLWSAITKAMAENRINWILKLMKLLFVSVLIVIIIQLVIVPLMPWVLKIWLKENAFEIDYGVVWVFVLFSSIFIWNAVLSVATSGLGKLKTQLWGYLFAAFFKILAIVLFSDRYTSWSFVVFVTAIGLFPYCCIQPFILYRQIKELNK